MKELSAKEREERTKALADRIKEVATCIRSGNIPTDSLTQQAIIHLAVLTSHNSMSFAKYVGYMSMIWDRADTMAMEDTIQKIMGVFEKAALEHMEPATTH